MKKPLPFAGAPFVALICTFLASPSGSWAQTQEKVFFGNLHSHTAYSDGTGTPREAYAFARDVAKLDFLAITEHNHVQAMGNDGVGIGADHSLYTGPDKESLIPAAKEFNQDGKFSAIYGQEFSSISKGNHVNVFDIGEVITAENGRFDELLEFLKTNPDSAGLPPVMMFNHPIDKPELQPKEYGEDDFGDDAEWLKRMGAMASLIEVVNGSNANSKRPPAPTEVPYLKFLNLGFKLAPTADQDNHSKEWGISTTARTGVIAPSLTKANIMEALRQRHVYASEDENLKIIAHVNDHLCGDVFDLPANSPLNISYDISDADEPDATYEIQVYKDAVGGPVATVASTINTTKGGGKGTIGVGVSDGTQQYLFLKITQHAADGSLDHAWSAPVWFQTAKQ